MDLFFRKPSTTTISKSAGLSWSIFLSIFIFLVIIHQATPDNRDLKFNSNYQTENSNDSLLQQLASQNNSYSYTCLPSCECSYEASTLEINCLKSPKLLLQEQQQNFTSTINNTTVTFNLSDGVRTLILRNVVLEGKSLKQVEPSLPPLTLVELEVYNVTIEPVSFFNSQLFRNSKTSLRQLLIDHGKMATTEVFSMDYKESLVAFAALGSLDSLTICDSNPLLSQIILQALPVVNHVKVFNSSVSQIYYSSFAHLTSLQSLNLSHNHLSTISNGLFDNLARLKSLDISYNQLTHLQENVFVGLNSMRKLDLSHNHIEYVDAEVFSQLEDLHFIDLSHNDVIQFFEPYFKHNNNLRVLKMSNAWVANTFINEFTANRSYKEMEGLISTLRGVEVLDLSDNHMTIIPETLSHVPRLTHVYLHGNPWICSCDDRWLLNWISTTNVTIESNGQSETFCFPTGEKGQQYPFISYFTSLKYTCNNSEITARYPFKYHAVMGKDKVLSCHTRNPPSPKITWITPSNNYITTNANFTSVHQQGDNDPNMPIIHPDGALQIHKVSGADYGLYFCVASYDDMNITHYVHLGMDVSIFADVRLMSIIVGLISSFGFLILVLLGQAIRFLLLRSGLHCIAVRTANQARRVRAFFDSMEQNKNSQLDWLRQNYNMQAKKIQDNCVSQLERIRESYTNQTKNLSEFRDYSAQQLATVRDQYQDQVRKVASYSAHRLGKVRENYVFNRNRVGKFSSHQLIRIREAYKWQAQTLNKILENLPQGLNLDSCRGVGACGRTDSMYLEDDEDFIAHASTSSTSRSSCRIHGDFEKKTTEHISLLIPPEFLASYLIPPMELELQNTSITQMVDLNTVPSSSTSSSEQDSNSSSQTEKESLEEESPATEETEESEEAEEVEEITSTKPLC